MDDLAKVITDLHALMAHDQDPDAMPVYAQCLTALTRIQQKRMNVQQQAAQSSPTQTLVGALGGGAAGGHPMGGGGDLMAALAGR